MTAILRGVAVALVLLIILPDTAWGWTPGTHIFLGETVLANLSVLPAAIAAVVREFPYDFLYGNIAADTSIAKKYAPVGRHCHAWHVGQEIYDLADSTALRAFGLGYLSHLAADTVAHNFFVPHQLVVTSRTIALGHSWWESRFETHLGDQYARTAMDLIRMDHRSSDAHLDSIISPTIFSVRTSRRLFRGMVGVTETLSWQSAFKVVAANSKWDLHDEVIDAHMGMSYQSMMENLATFGGAARRLDPAGGSSLSLAKKIRLGVMRNKISSDTDVLTEMAEENFALPESSLSYWDASQSHKPWSDNGSSGTERLREA